MFGRTSKVWVARNSDTRQFRKLMTTPLSKLVAYKRFADMVPLAIDHEVVRGVDRNTLEMLNKRLGIHGPEGHLLAKDMANESPQVADRRQELTKKLERLQIANAELLELSV